MVEILFAKKTDFDTHAARTDDPHSVTKMPVGLGNVLDVVQVENVGVAPSIEAALAASRSAAATAGRIFIATDTLEVSRDNGTTWDDLVGADLVAIEALSATGLLSRTGAGAFSVRTLAAPAKGFTITNPDGVSGNPTSVLADDLAALEALSGTGGVERTGASAWATFALTTFAKTILDDADAGTVQATLNLEIGTDVAAQSHVGSGGTSHADVVAAGDDGFMTGGDKTKLDGIAPGAEVNLGGVLQSTQIFTTTATYTKPAGLVRARVRVIGSGGGSGGVAATGAGTSAAAGGGGAGGYSEELLDASAIGATEDVTVGTAGTAGASGSNNGGGGGDSSFGTLLSATGGAGGDGGPAQNAANGGQGGDGGIGADGDINVTGGAGGPGVTDATHGGSIGGFGGNSVFGGGGKALTTAATTSGSNAGSHGGGGSGAANGNSQSAAGGATGSTGIVIVEEYF